MPSGFLPRYEDSRARQFAVGGVDQPLPGVQAERAFDFWDGVGINTHLTRPGTNAYADVPACVDAIGRLNIAHIRDGGGQTTAAFIAAINNVYATTGAKVSMVMGKPALARPGIWPAGLLNTFFTNGLNINAVAVFEGPNEQNLAGHNLLPANGYTEAQWAEATRDHMIELWNSADAMTVSAWNTKPIMGYSYANSSFNYNPNAIPPQTPPRMVAAQNVTDWDAWCDIGNVHRYYVNNMGAGIAGTLANVRQYQYNAPGKPLIVTETGYHTYMPEPSGHRPTPVDVTAWYIVKSPFEWLRTPGVTRMYFYELLNEYPPADVFRELQGWFGQFSYKAPGVAGNFAFTPGGESLANLLGLYKDAGGAGLVTGKLDYTITAAAPSLKVALHQRSTDGAFLLALWRDLNLWTWTSTAPPYGNYVTVADVNVTIDLGKTWATVEHRSPSNVVDAGGGNFLVETLSGVSSVTVPVGKKLLVLVIK